MKKTWQPIDENTPKDRRILVRNPARVVHCANWSKSIETDDVAWRVDAWSDGDGGLTCLLALDVHEWAEIPE